MDALLLIRATWCQIKQDRVRICDLDSVVCAKGSSLALFTLNLKFKLPKIEVTPPQKLQPAFIQIRTGQLSLLSYSFRTHSHLDCRDQN